MKDWSRSRLTIVLLLMLVYTVGLVQGLHYPWVGLHDFNGAFYSQLARNILRYPFEIHHGMPIVAVGAAVPAATERSIYGTHPPGLVWMLAAMFRFAGDAEWAARLAPVLASVLSLGLLVWIIGRSAGWNTAIVSGVIYAFLPMSVFFGRMVDQEAVTLPLMLGAIVLQRRAEEAQDARRRTLLTAGLAVALVAMIWTDWAGLLFAGLFCVQRLWQCRRCGTDLRAATALSGSCVLATIGLALYIVYAGLGGSWEALASVFASRREAVHVEPLAQGLRWAVENLSWPGVVLLAVGTLVQLGRVALRAGGPASAEPADPGAAEAPATVGAPFMGLGLVTLTGILWLALFWRQFMIHQYWLYYLGPWTAAAGASFILSVTGRIARVSRTASGIALLAGVMCCVVAGLRGTSDFFERVSFPLGYVQMCRTVNQMTRPDERVTLADSPVMHDPYGSKSYVLRSIVPPLAYYMDRAFDTAESADQLAACPADRVLVISATRAGEQQAALQPVFAGADVERIGDYLIVDRRRLDHAPQAGQ